MTDIFKNPHLNDLASFIDDNDLMATEISKDNELAPIELWRNNQGDDILQQRIRIIASQIGVSPGEIVDVIPCTPLQEALIAITMKNPTAYISRQVFKLDETVDTSRLLQSWNTLADSAPILRSHILLGRQTIQVVTRCPLEWHEGQNIEDYLEQDRTKGISIGEPLVRLGLVHCACERFFI